MTEPIEQVAAEMVKQIRLGHPMFCAGVHDGGEADWVEWEVAFIRLIATLRLEQAQLRRELDEAREDGKRLEWVVQRTMFQHMSDGSVRLTMGDGYEIPDMKGSRHSVGFPVPYTDRDIRDAIDAARKETP